VPGAHLLEARVVAEQVDREDRVAGGVAQVVETDVYAEGKLAGDLPVGRGVGRAEGVS
jgi:hypothetical protein